MKHDVWCTGRILPTLGWNKVAYIVHAHRIVQEHTESTET